MSDRCSTVGIVQDSPRFRAAHRAALDHTLALIAESSWGRSLVLRGSMTMAAWVGETARPPADLDWILPEAEGCAAPDPGDPYPWVDDLSWVQHWPEAAFGAVTNEMWEDEQFETFGLRPILPPEGLHWVDPDDCFETYTWTPLLGDLADTIRERPTAPAGVILDGDQIDGDPTGTLDYYDTPGVRVVVPWHTAGPDPMAGAVQLDFAAGQSLPDAPVWTLVPRGDGGTPIPCATASREASLAWKLLWLYTESSQPRSYGATPDGGQGKDLYDAVLLAESRRTHLTLPLLRKVLGDTAPDFENDDILAWVVNWESFQHNHPHVTGSLREWLERLARALTPLRP